MRGIVIASVLLAVVVNQANAGDLTFGDQCSSTSACDSTKGLECTVSYTQCGTTGVCDCIASTPHWSAGSGECITVKIKGEACGHADDCRGASMTCTGNVCTCGTSTDDVSCNSGTEKLVGEACTATNDATCWSDMTCPTAPDNVCTCPANKFEDGNGYCRSHYHGESCAVDADCVGFHVACDTNTNKCACEATYSVLSDTEKGCTADGAKEAEVSCASDDATGHDSCKGTMMCKTCGAGELQCLTPGAPQSNAGKLTPGMLLLLISGISFLY